MVLACMIADQLLLNILICSTFYFIENVMIDNILLDDEDWVGAFKDLDNDGIGDVCVGAKDGIWYAIMLFVKLH